MNNPHRRSISQNQRPFENCWNVTYKKPNYDALADPHATYYFMNRSMKKHLKGLRKSIEREGQFVQKKSVKANISRRIKQYDTIGGSKYNQHTFKSLKSESSLASLALTALRDDDYKQVHSKRRVGRSINLTSLEKPSRNQFEAQNQEEKTYNGRKSGSKRYSTLAGQKESKEEELEKQIVIAASEQGQKRQRQKNRTPDQSGLRKNGESYLPKIQQTKEAVRRQNKKDSSIQDDSATMPITLSKWGGEGKPGVKPEVSRKVVRPSLAESKNSQSHEKMLKFILMQRQKIGQPPQ